MASSLFSRHESARRKWEKIKADPELYAKKLKQQRTRYNKQSKEQRRKGKTIQNNWRNSMRRVAKDIGNCSFCFKEKDNPKFKICSRCRLRMRNYYKQKVKGGIK